MYIREHIKNSFLLMDGAMGTMLQKFDLPAGEPPELSNILRPEIVTSIHREYVDSGSDVVTANTFGANAMKLHGPGYTASEIVEAGIRCARGAGAKAVALDIGPLGKLLEPLGTVPFETAYELFAEQVLAGEQAGADLILIETFFDLYEARAAILAAKENSSLPVFCTMTYQDGGRTFTGTDPMTAVITLQALGVDALGTNCSLGPDAMAPVIHEIIKYAKCPVIAQPNAGLPRLHDGKTVYDMDENIFTTAVEKLIDMGVTITGGCCGTSPQFIRALRKALDTKTVVPRKPMVISAVASAAKTVVLDGHNTVIGGRLNTALNPELESALRENRTDYITEEAVEQLDGGADILDISIYMPDAAEMTARAVKAAGVAGAPLQISCGDDAAAVEAGVRVCNGKPIISLVDGRPEVMKAIFPIAKKYGAMVAYTVPVKDGAPDTAEDRAEIARRMLDCAPEYGIPTEDVLIR